jgi:NTE family protein
MPFGKEGLEPGLALALSGGGFRAALFHLGSIWRLNELGYLPLLDRISSVSGGSITAGLLGVRWAALAFQQGRATNFGDQVVLPLRDFCTRTVDVAAVGEGLFHPFKSAADILEDAYDDHLFGSARLHALPDRPRFVFNATHCGTGVNFRFSKPYAGDYRIGLIRNPNFLVATAVAASSAFPPVLSPVVVKVADPAVFERTEGADLYDDVRLRERLVLTDGGVYDNLGLETVWARYTKVLVSDAGAPFEVKDRVGEGWVDQAARAMGIATGQAIALRKRALISDLEQPGRGGAYWGIKTPIGDYGLADALPCKSEAILELAGMRTRLNGFSESEQCRLINWGYAICDAAVRRYLPAGAAAGAGASAAAAPPPAWPYPHFALG